MKALLCSVALVLSPVGMPLPQASKPADKPSTQAPFLRFAPAGMKRELCGDESHDAIVNGLQWLADNQLGNGAWVGADGGDRPSVASTSLALLAFLGDGQNTDRGDFQGTIKDAARWLLGTAVEEQDPRAQGMALCALARLKFDVRDSVENKALEEIAKSLMFKSDLEGTWSAQIQTSGLSQGVTMAWCTAGLVQADRVGTLMADRARQDLLDWVETRVQPSGKVEFATISGSREHGTAVLLIMRLMLEADQRSGEFLQRQANRLTRPRARPEWDQGDLEYWLATTTALYMMEHEGAQDFYSVIRSMLLDNVLRGGTAAGSWPGLGMVPEAGAVRSTAMAVLCLESPYRLSVAKTSGGRKASLTPDAMAASTRLTQRIERKRTEIKGYGGEGTQAALNGALTWLVSAQGQNGAWQQTGNLHTVGTTGLALLALLGDGNSPTHGPHKKAVARGVKWLRKQQDPETGLIGKRSSLEFHYDHAIATTVLVETYETLPTPELKASAELAVRYCLAARNPGGVWRYGNPPAGDNDTSLTTWMTLALRTALEAGLAVDPVAFDDISGWFRSIVDPATGRVGYNTIGSASARLQGVNDHFPVEYGEALTAAGLLTHCLMDGRAPSRSPAAFLEAQQATLVLARLPEWDKTKNTIDMYYWYYGSYAMFQVGGDAWERWNQAMREAVLGSQRKNGTARGSWDPVGAWGHAGGRVYSTAILALTLEVYYRTERTR